MDTRGQWVTVDEVRAVHILIHVASLVTLAAVWAINLWIHLASVVTVASVLRYKYGYMWPVGDSG